MRSPHQLLHQCFARLAGLFFARYHMHFVRGVGICDAIERGYSRNPIYKVWSRMLERCYSAAYQANRPTYRGATVDDRWLLFSRFQEWAEDFYIDGMALDKDIISPGNRIYGPEKCCFVPHAINNLLTTSSASRGVHPLGVDFHATSKRYRARVWSNGKQVCVGHFPTPYEAHVAWQKAKIDAIQAAIYAHPNLDPRAIAGLQGRVCSISEDIGLGRQTLRV